MTNTNSITIGHTAKLNIVLWNEEPVLTFKMIDDAHARSTPTAKVNFSRNRERFMEGKHFHLVPFEKAEALRVYGVEVPPRGLTLITKRGYLLLVKSFTDDLAWDVQEQLVDYYFDGQPQHEPVEPLSAKQLQQVRDQMGSVTRYLKQCHQSLAQTLYLKMKAEFGYDKIENLPARDLPQVIQWLGRYEEVTRQVYLLTSQIESGFLQVVKGTASQPDDFNTMLASLDQPLRRALAA